MSEQRKTNEVVYVQFSKKLTKWALTLCAVAFVLCLCSVSQLGMSQYSTTALTTLYTTFCTVLGVIVSGYHGNSTVEKYQRLKGQVESVMTSTTTVETTESNG